MPILKTLFAKLHRATPLIIIIAVHVSIFALLQNSFSPNTVAPGLAVKEVTVNFITPDPVSEAPPVPKASTPPKTVPIATPAKPTILPTPVETALAAPAPTHEAVNTTTESVIAHPQPAETTPVASTAPAVPKTITGVSYLQEPQVVYPMISKRMNEQGRVLLHILVDEFGVPQKIKIQQSSGSERLDEAAKVAAAKALFKPYREDGKSQPVYVVVPINFRLNS
ncbi:energy transducer TonB [Solimicrobium silvestre]|uniref:TonB family C-terminal domain n=1 Tax=Solimicrobium silvestre TaxID=2099400 RepID=A0A2S9H0W9_9BURK|nr:energy transducer TonB [Solimicrobium silvestre]PRC93621.1 TonB family C-terminal domain [Solimicrobium silvestre]